jgi:cobalt-zinc-cadmium efflux system membrane fusion protein
MGSLVSAAVIVLAVCVLVGFAGFVLGIPLPWRSASASETEAGPPRAAPTKGVELVPGVPHTLYVPDDVQAALGIQKAKIRLVATAKPPTEARSLVLPGSTALDPARLMRIRARFAPAEVVEIAQVVDTPAQGPTGQTQFRELRPGDVVKKGDLLGVFFSVDVGSKKNDLIDGLLQLKLDQEILDRSRKVTNALPEIQILSAQRNVNGDHNANSRALNMLKVWGIPERDIQAVFDEAEEVGRRGGRRDPDKEKAWGRVELRAPDDGTLVERNVALHEMVVDNTVNLFQVAKVDRLLVIANCPEDDLPMLQALTSAQRQWTVRTVGASPSVGIPGRIDEIGYLIDPNQHTAVLKGYIDNPDGKIRAGQYVSATVKLPPPEGVVEVPIDAVVEDGPVAVVFVETDAAKRQYTMRRVQLTHRFEKTAFVRSEPIPRAEQRTREEEELGVLPREPLRPGERVLTTAVGELKAALLDRESQPSKEKGR